MEYQSPCEDCPRYKKPSKLATLAIRIKLSPASLNTDCKGPVTVSRGELTPGDSDHSSPHYNWRTEKICDEDIASIKPGPDEELYDPNRPTIVTNPDSGQRAAAFVSGPPNLMAMHQAGMSIMSMLDALDDDEDLSELGIQSATIASTGPDGETVFTKKDYPGPAKLEQ